MMIRPPTSSIGNRASESLSISASIVTLPQASTSGIGQRNNKMLHMQNRTVSQLRSTVLHRTLFGICEFAPVPYLRPTTWQQVIKILR